MVKQQHSVLAGTFMGSLVFIAIALWFVLGGDDDALAVPSLLLLAVPLVAGAVVHVVVDAVGYRTAAITPGTPLEEASRTAVMRYMSTVVMRFALVESIALVSIALAFVVQEGGYLLVLLGCGTSLVLMAVHVWPGARPVNKTAASLERDGARSGLREAFGLEGRPGGAIQEL